MNTLFTLPEAGLYADLVEHLEKNANINIRIGDEVAEENEQGEAPPRLSDHNPGPVPSSDLSYSNLFQDVRVSIDCIFLSLFLIFIHLFVCFFVFLFIFFCGKVLWLTELFTETDRLSPRYYFHFYNLFHFY